jgi:hypothetical protein
MEIKYSPVTNADRFAAFTSVNGNPETYKSTIPWGQIIMVTGLSIILGILIHKAYIDKKERNSFFKSSN